MLGVLVSGSDSSRQETSVIFSCVSVSFLAAVLTWNVSVEEALTRTDWALGTLMACRESRELGLIFMVDGFPVVGIDGHIVDTSSSVR